MRVNPEQIDFANYLLTLSNGTSLVYPHIGEDIIRIASTYLVGSMEELIDKVFPELENGYTDRYFVSHKAILTPLNANVDKLNEDIMAIFPGVSKTYLSADSVADEDMANTYPTDFLNSITLSGMPPHSMTLKDQALVMSCNAESESWPWQWSLQWDMHDCFDTWTKGCGG